MGRSVWTHGRASATVFTTISGHMGFCHDCDIEVDHERDTCPECNAEMYDDSGDTQTFEFECLVEDIQRQFCEAFPSMAECDHWPERESHAIVENKLCMVVISEYCGMVSIGVVPVESDDYYSADTTGLAEQWTRVNAERLLHDRFGTLDHIGTMSNGESVYERRAQQCAD